MQTSNFQAEYGRSSGATITVVTRSGSRDFHGSAAFYKRDDALNGNEYLRRQHVRLGQTAQCERAALHVRQRGLDDRRARAHPGHLLQQEPQQAVLLLVAGLLARTDPGNLNQRRVPTALERQGDFSQTFDNSGRVWSSSAIRCSRATARHDRRPGLLPRQHHPGQPHRSDGAGAAESVPAAERHRSDRHEPVQLRFQTEQDWPRNDQVLRVDWNVAPSTTAYGRLQFGYEKRSGGVSLLGSTGGWPQMATKYEIDTVSYVNTLLHTFSPTTVRRIHRRRELGAPVHEPVRSMRRATRTTAGSVLPGMPQFFPAGESAEPPAAGDLHRRPSGTIASFGIEQRFPFFGYNTLFNVSSNITKLQGAHTMKAGLFVEHTTRPAARTSSFNGNVQLQHRRARTH